jgi:hypothetical protein
VLLFSVGFAFPVAQLSSFRFYKIPLQPSFLGNTRLPTLAGFAYRLVGNRVRAHPTHLWVAATRMTARHVEPLRWIKLSFFIWKVKHLPT